MTLARSVRAKIAMPSELHIVPLTLRAANAFVEKHHRHHGAVPGGLDFFRIGVIDSEGLLRGVAIISRPPNRNSDDGQTCEVVRCATDGTRNACSFLYGQAARIANIMGFSRIITYTLESESGASLRACGWRETKRGIRSWWQSHQVPGRTVKARDHYTERKVAWEKMLEAPLYARATEHHAPQDPQPEPNLTR